MKRILEYTTVLTQDEEIDCILQTEDELDVVALISSVLAMLEGIEKPTEEILTAIGVLEEALYVLVDDAIAILKTEQN